MDIVVLETARRPRPTVLARTTGEPVPSPRLNARLSPKSCPRAGGGAAQLVGGQQTSLRSFHSTSVNMVMLTCNASPRLSQLYSCAETIGKWAELQSVCYLACNIPSILQSQGRKATTSYARVSDGRRDVL